jgi:putative oxidoreductase
MTSIPAVSDKRLDTALVILRLAVGAIFIAHGWQKVFTFGIAGITSGFAQMGVPFPTLVAPLVSVLELVGGFALVLGLATRVAGLLLAIDMFCAILIVHGKNGFFAPKGFEFVMGNMAMALTLAIAGAGAYSLDAMLSRRGRTPPK